MERGIAKRKRVTMKDVAAELGVSIVSVSKALAGKEGVSVELREKIVAKARAMGYVSKQRRAAENNLSVNVAIIISERFIKESSLYFKACQRMLMKLSEKGYIGILEIIRRENEEVGVLPNVIRVNTVTQAIVIGEMNSLFLDMLVQTKMEIIFFDFQKEKYDVDCVVGDDVNSGFLLTRYLVKSGYKRIGFAGNYQYTRRNLERFIGYIKYMVLKGQMPNRQWWIPDRDANGSPIRLRLPTDMPEAFVCCSDEVAYRLIAVLENAGYSVPADVAVVGCDDHAEKIPLNTFLTTYRMDVDEMIDQCIYIVEQRARKNDYRRGTTIVYGQLVIRESTDIKI